MQIQNLNRASAPVVEARCPHGGMPGACPACGGGGGSGDGGGAAVKRGAGLMDWNEAYAAWKSTQVSRTRQEDFLKSAALNQNAVQSQTFMQAQRVMLATLLARALYALSDSGVAPISWLGRQLGQVAASPVRLIMQVVSAVRESVAALADQALQRLGQLAEAVKRLASTLGEVQRLSSEFFQGAVETFRELLARARWIRRLFNIEGMLATAGSLIRTFAQNPILRAVSRPLKSLFGKLKGLFAPEEEEQSESHSA